MYSEEIDEYWTMNLKVLEGSRYGVVLGMYTLPAFDDNPQ